MTSRRRLLTWWLLVGRLAWTAVAAESIVCSKVTSFSSLLTYWCICTPCHLCYFNLATGCHVDTSHAVTLSDGHDIPTRQPSLAPSDWFLTTDEMTNARMGVPRTDLTTFSTNNAVHVFAATNEYFRAIYDDLASTKANDSVFFNGWSLANVPYLPDVDPTVTVKSVWGDLLARQAHFRGLLFENLEEASSMADMQSIRFGRPRDGHLGALHQKSTVIQKPDGGAVAYIGGVDHDLDRWDTKFHNASGVRNASKIRQKYNGWVDVHAQIRGPAAQDILGNFQSRWNDPAMPSISAAFKLLAAPNSSHAKAPQPISFSTAPWNATSSDGSHAVQIVRTYSCTYGGYKLFAPRGETSILAARIKAIQLAKNFIYIEDQYFIDVPDLTAALLAVLPTIQRLVVVTCERSSMSTAVGYAKYLFDLVAPLQQKFPHKFQLYKTTADIYVHTKVLLVDDVFLSVGSSNWNVRSMTSDAEIAANVVDHGTIVQQETIVVAKLARQFRIDKFGELTRFSVDFSNLTYVQAADAIVTYAATQPSAFITPFVVQYELYFELYASVKAIFDGDGRCVDTSAEFCATVTSNDFDVVQIACQCARDKMDLSVCPAMVNYNSNQVAAQLYTAKFHKVLAICIVVVVAIIVLVAISIFCIHRRCCKNRKSKTNPAATLPDEKPNAPSTLIKQ
ncbi:hypothetical protein Ae201684P_001701 [Aphanomyces euteiches]|nr:hypothetical protein Ae201684P_001701 [Aphanomyces euteiches]